MGKRRSLADQAKINAMWIECPYCRSEPGVYCEVKWGGVAYTPHKARFTRAAKLRAYREKNKEKKA